MKKRRRGLGCLVLILFVILVGVIVNVSRNSDPTSTGQNAGKAEVSAEELKKQGLEFDEQAWKDYLTMYETHNSFMKNMSAYSEGKISKLDFYDYCKDLEGWFAKASISFNYAKTEDERTYLSTFQTFALADQTAAKSIIKYLDSNATKDLSNARVQIQRATEAATTISSNRVILLSKIGVTKEESDKMLKEAVADVKALDSKK
ncbi:hypothetical protein [Cohnella sp. GbtcB17]|uniref:hypothetical protein n=1 Tax=Cohnella sp. GbtcB17 TaxID=2824762 RepID=UPI001C2F48FC|nr:hypothetical protein [Cohnella sp. GbtcB17]